MTRYIATVGLMVVFTSDITWGQSPFPLTAESQQAALERQQVLQKECEIDEFVTERLFRQYVLANGKIASSSVSAAIQLVAARGNNEEFRALLLTEFENSCDGEGNSRTVRQNILRVIGNILANEYEGGARWRFELEKQARAAGTYDLPQQASPCLPNETLYRESLLLTRVIARGYQADSSDIDHFTCTVIRAHHPQSKQFLLDVLRHPQSDSVGPAANSPLKGEEQVVGKWTDHQGGSWRDARFHAAIGLAELGEPVGVEWLIAKALPNDFGLDDSVSRSQHYFATGSSLRENCRYALTDLFDLKGIDQTNQDWPALWGSRRDNFTPHPVGLKPQ